MYNFEVLQDGEWVRVEAIGLLRGTSGQRTVTLLLDEEMPITIFNGLACKVEGEVCSRLRGLSSGRLGGRPTLLVTARVE